MSPEFIVIDTNIFISAALSPAGTAHQAFAQAIQRFTIVQSDRTYQEVAERIYKSKFDKYVTNETREQFLNSSKITVNLSRQPPKSQFVEL